MIECAKDSGHYHVLADCLSKTLHSPIVGSGCPSDRPLGVGKWTRVAALRPPRRLSTSALARMGRALYSREINIASDQQSHSGTERGPELWNDFDEISEPSEGTRSRGMRRRHTTPHSASMRFSLSRTARTEFGLNRPQPPHSAGFSWSRSSTRSDSRCFDGTDLFAREEVFNEVPRDILAQFSGLITVNQPEDCA
jgi:hypothetical protein